MLTVLTLAGLTAAGYVISLRMWPIKSCGKCDGSGKTRSPSGRSWRACKRCSGSGGRVRVGRRVLDSLGRGARNL